MDYTKRFIDELYRLNGCYPNLQGMPVRPGTVLTRAGGKFTIIGRLDTLAKEKEPELAARVRTAIERVAPGPGGEAGVRRVTQLKSSGTTVFGSNAGVKVKATDQMEVEVKLGLSFTSEGDFYFDTAEPAYWYTFSDEEMADVRAAALRHLENGNFVVTGVTWSPAWVWGASRKANSTLGFDTAVDVGTVNLANVADLFVSAGFNVAVDSAATLREEFTNSVACFACLKRKVEWFQPTLEATAFSGEGEAFDEAEPVVVKAGPDDLLDP